MDRQELIERISSVSQDLSTLNLRVRNSVYHSSWDPEVLRRLRLEVTAKRAELSSLKAQLSEARIASEADVPEHTPSEDPKMMSVDDSRRIANALFTQRPLAEGGSDWDAYVRVCASLVRVLDHELIVDGGFDRREFLLHCGLSPEHATDIARTPGEFIRRSEDLT